MIKLFSTHCPRCNVLEKKLTQAGVNFELITDFDTKLLLDKGFDTAPVLSVGDTFMNYTDAIKWLKDKQ